MVQLGTPKLNATPSSHPSFLAPALAVLLLLLVLASGAGLLGRAVITASREPSGPPLVQPEVPVTAMNQKLEPASNSPQLLADPTEPRFVVAAHRLDAPRFGCSLQVSADGGRGWITAQPLTQLPAGADTCYAPEVAFDRHGLLYYLFVGLQGPGNEPMGVFLTTSADRARTFSPPRQVLGPSNFGVRMAMDTEAGDKGRLHLVWLHATSDPPLGGFGPPPNPIVASYSDDGGNTFSDPVQVSDPARQRVVAPALALGPDNAVHVAYYDLGDDAVDYQGLEGPVWKGTWSVLLASSTDGGGHFGASRVVDSSIAPPERVMLIFTMAPPALAADEDRLCLAWTDAREGDPDVILRCSGDQGGTWSNIRRLNDDNVGNGRRQYLPRLAMAPGGRIDAIFYDRRDDRLNVLNHVMYTFSTDGGKSFAPNRRLTAEHFESRIGQQYTNVAAVGQVEFGARLGLLSGSSEVLAAWTDTRNSKLLAGTTGQDLFATTVEFPVGDSQPWWLTVAGAVLVVLGLIGARNLAGTVTWRRHPVPQA